MPKFKKPSGVELEVHPNSVEYVKTLGWEEVKPKRKRRTKAEMAKK